MNELKYAQCRICGLIDSTSVMRKDEATEYEYLCPVCYSYEYPDLSSVNPEFINVSPNESRTKLRIKYGHRHKLAGRKKNA